MESFCSLNNVLEALVDRDVFSELCGLKVVADVVRSSLFDKVAKASLLKLYRRAQSTESDRHWITVGTALLKARDTLSEQPFDACPLYLMHFIVRPDGGVVFEMKLRLLHTVMYDRATGSLL